MKLDDILCVRDAGVVGSNPVTPTIDWRTTGALPQFTPGLYRIRDGRQAIVERVIAGPTYQLQGRVGSNNVLWTTEGRRDPDKKTHVDLIEPWKEPWWRRIWG